MICHQTPGPQPDFSFAPDSPEEDASMYGDLHRRKRSPAGPLRAESHDREFPVTHNALVLASPRILHVHEREKIGQIRLSPFSATVRNTNCRRSMGANRGVGAFASLVTCAVYGHLGFAQ